MSAKRINKTESLRIRVTKADKKLWGKAAKMQGIKLSKLVREAVTDKADAIVTGSVILITGSPEPVA